MPLKTYAWGLLAALCLAGPAAAQSVDLPLRVDGDRLVLEAEGHELIVPMPDWIDVGAADWADRVATSYEDIDSQAELELYPRGEGEAIWTKSFGARIMRVDQPTLVRLRAMAVDVYARACRPDATAFFQLEPDNGDDIPPLGFVCGAYRDPALADKGEVTVVAFQKSDKGMAMVHQGWRGAAFDIADTASWPVPVTVVEEQVARLGDGAALAHVD